MKGKQYRFLYLASGVLLAVTILGLYVTNREVPFMMDDLWYSTMLSSETPIGSLGDIITSQIWHYHNWGGRSITHGILQLTLLLGENGADILNVAVTLLLAGVMCIVAGERRFPAFFACLGMLVGLNANWKMNMFWQAGAANYLYITVFILFFLHCYLRGLTEGKALPGITLWILPLGLMAGWSNENMGPAVWVISVLAMLLLLREKKKVEPWMLLGSAACLTGSALCILAPGNYVRIDQATENEYGLLWQCFLRGYAQSKAALEYLFPVLVLLGMLLVLRHALVQEPIPLRLRLLLFCSLLTWGAMILSPHYPDRATFGTMVLLICAGLSAVRDILDKRKDMALPLWGAAGLVWLRGMFFLGEYLAICWGWIR